MQNTEPAGRIFCLRLKDELKKKIKTENTKMQRTVTKQEKTVMPSEHPSPGDKTRENGYASRTPFTGWSVSRNTKEHRGTELTYQVWKHSA